MNALFFFLGNDWKRMRMLMSGVFTSGKLKLMLPHIAKAAVAAKAAEEKVE